MPRSVMMAATYFAGVTSKAGFSIATPSGIICLSADVGHFSCVALLDGNFAAVGRVQIYGRNRRGHVERDAVLFGQNGDRVGADFVGHVAVGGDAVGADYDGSDFALLHHGSGHVVGDYGRGNAVFHQLPGGQARALQEGTRLVGVDVNLLALFDGGADHAERGAVAGGGQRSGVAVGEHAAVAGISVAPWRPMAWLAAMSSACMRWASSIRPA